MVRLRKRSIEKKRLDFEEKRFCWIEEMRRERKMGDDDGSWFRLWKYFLLITCISIFLFGHYFSEIEKKNNGSKRAALRKLNEVEEVLILHKDRNRPKLHLFTKVSLLQDPDFYQNSYFHNNYKCFSSNNREVPCMNDDQDALQIQLRLYDAEKNSLSHSTIRLLLEESFEKADSSEAFRKLRIEFAPDSSELVRTLVDGMITHRLWLYISSESFPTSENRLLHITLDRYPQGYEGSLRLLSSIQFPDQHACDTTPLLLGRNNPSHPGWGSVVSMYHRSQEIHPFGILSIYVSVSNRLNESTCFISIEDCPHEKNKWLCAFLPSTNCTLPSFIKDCTEEKCVMKYQDTDYFTAIFTNFSEDSRYIASKQSTEYEEMSIQSHQPHNRFQERHKHAGFGSFQYVLPYSSIHQNAPLPLLKMSTLEAFHEQFYLRMNRFYRMKVAEYIEEFYSRYPELTIDYPPRNRKFRCIAANIRRGDRINYGSNMSTFCQDHPNVMDYGCSSSLPFGLVNLSSVVNKATLLVNNHNMTTGEPIQDDDVSYNIFVASDDPAWLENQKTIYDESFLNENEMKTKQKKKWNIYPIFPSKSFQIPMKTDFSSNLDYANYLAEFRYKKGTISGVYFMATLKLFQQCDGYIGHFGSGVSWLMYGTMCVSSNFGMGYCPPAYDLRSGL